MICLEKVVFSYKKGPEENRVLNDVSIRIDEGDYCAIVGPNGSGKSTLARHLNAMLIPDSGEVSVLGMNTKDRESIWSIRSSVGMVFQNPDNQIVSTTVEEDVAFGPENLGVEPKEIKVRVEKSLKIVGLEDLRYMDPSRLSGGQKQRLAVAGVIAMKPRCIVLDEATSMLDPMGRTDLLHLVRRLNIEEGITVVYITHNLEEIMGFDRVILMQNGGIAFDSNPKDLFTTGLLEKMGFEPQPIIKLGQMLRNLDVDVPHDVISVESMVNWLCK